MAPLKPDRRIHIGNGGKGWCDFLNKRVQPARLGHHISRGSASVLRGFILTNNSHFGFIQEQ